MKTIFVIGAGTGLTAIENAKKVLELKQDIDIICVESMEDVPFKERLKSDPSIIQQIHKFTAPPLLPQMTCFDDKNRKSHRRPYMYHR